MNTRQRFVGILTGRPVDRVPFIKVFGGTNAIVPQWEAQRPGISQCIDQVLGFEGVYRGWQVTEVNVGLSRLGKDEMLEEDSSKAVTRRADGTVRLRVKGQDYRGMIVEWPVKSRRHWQRIKDEFLDPDDPERFPAEWLRHVEDFRCRDYPLQLSHGGVYGFARNMMGDENLAYAFYDDPQLVHDIMDTYTDRVIAIWSRMVGDVEFDLIECWEDMACRTGMLISPRTFREFMKPNYGKIRCFAATHAIPIILVDSDGLIEELAELMFESGVTAMYPFEVQSGNDLCRVRQRLPVMAAIGGLDKNAMASGRKAIDAEIEKARRLIRLGRFIPGPDHFVLSDVTWENYRYFMEQLREAVMTTKVEA